MIVVSCSAKHSPGATTLALAVSCALASDPEDTPPLLVELDAAGEPVWQFASPHRAGARRELVAMLFDVERLVEPTPFLERLAGAQAP